MKYLQLSTIYYFELVKVFLGVMNIAGQIKENRLRAFGHVERRNNIDIKYIRVVRNR